MTSKYLKETQENQGFSGCQKSKRFLSRAKLIEPTIRIGKSGITDSQIQEIKKQLKSRKLVKIKFLRSFIETTDKKKAVEQIAEQTNAKVVQVIGFTVTIYKR